MRLLLIVPLLVAACDMEIAKAREGSREPAVIEDAKLIRVQLEIQRLTSELEQYHMRRGEWPESWRQIKRSGLDPWGGEYIFEIEDDHALVFSAGPDDEIGTGDDVYLGVPR